MTRDLGRRLDALEQAHPQVGPLSVLVTFSSPTGVERDLRAVREMRGPMLWRRRDDESERQFLGRALREAPRNELGIAVLVEASA